MTPFIQAFYPNRFFPNAHSHINILSIFLLCCRSLQTTQKRMIAVENPDFLMQQSCFQFYATVRQLLTPVVPKTNRIKWILLDIFFHKLFMKFWAKRVIDEPPGPPVFFSFGTVFKHDIIIPPGDWKNKNSPSLENKVQLNDCF